ncbi:MAG TPA: hypothetical protein VF824_20030, partial [Thermoanaerobaculia bacterium]
ERTELLADVKYTIDNFKPGVDYYVAPLFARNGSDVTFNMLDRTSDAPKIDDAEGQITVRYPVARELASPHLARPVTMWFYVMERVGNEGTRVIGKTGPFNFTIAAR